jgi:hypothetical protein
MLKTLGARWLDYQIDWIEKILRSLLVLSLIILATFQQSFHLVLDQYTLWMKLIVLITLLYGASMICLCIIQTLRYRKHKKRVETNLKDQKQQALKAQSEKAKEHKEHLTNIELLNEELAFSEEMLVASKQKQRHVLLSSFLFMIGLFVLSLLWCTGAKLSHHMQWFLTPSTIIIACGLTLLLYGVDTLAHALSRKKDHMDYRFTFLKACYFAFLDHEPTLKDPDWLAEQKASFQIQIQTFTSSDTLKKIEAYRVTIASWKKKAQQKKSSAKAVEAYAMSMSYTLDKLVAAYHQKISPKKRFMYYTALVFKGIFLPIADMRHVGALILYHLYILLPQKIKQRSNQTVKQLFCDKLFDLHATFS